MSKKRVYLVAISLILVALPILGACAPQQAGPAGKEPYKLGVTFPQTGPQAVYGQILLPAIEIGVEDVNKKGGVNGRPLQLVIEDSKGTPEGGVAAMRKVVQVDGVPVVLTIFTNVATAQIPVGQELKVPMIATTAAPGLPATSKGWYFAHSLLLNQTLPLLMKVWEQKKVKRLFAFFPDTALYQFGSPLVKEAWTKTGGAYDEARYKLGETDFRGLVSRAKAFDPDAIFMWGHGTLDQPTILKQIRELGIQASIYEGSGEMTVKDYREAAGGAGEGVVFVSSRSDKQVAKDFIAAYKAKLGFEPSFAAFMWYDIVPMIAEAIKKNGYSTEGIRKGLAEIKDFPLVGGGKATMDDTGQSKVEMATYVVKGGQIEEYK